MSAFQYPRPVTQLHQIELTTHCNLRCKYCPQFPELPRKKEYMSAATYDAFLALLRHYCEAGTQGELAFTGIGEPTMHEFLPDFIGAARGVMGSRRAITMSTNGITFTESIARQLAPLGVQVYVSMHRPEKAGLAVELAKKYGIYAGSNISFADSAFNWAGQVKWFVSHQRVDCEYLFQGWGAVLVDGCITTCCLDADGSGVIGTVHDAPESLVMKPYKHCDTCSFDVPRTTDGVRFLTDTDAAQRSKFVARAVKFREFQQ